MEAGALCESAGTRLVSPDRAAPAVLSAQPFGVTHVVGNRDQNGDPMLARLSVDELVDRRRVGRQQRVDQQQLSIRLQCETRLLVPKTSRVPLGVPGGPAPDAIVDPFGSLSHGGA